MTYLELVNNVLRRLQESTVASVSENDYSQLIGVYVNQAKEMVENAWVWQSLKTSYTFNTVAGTAEYDITGLKQKYQPLLMLNLTNRVIVPQKPLSEVLYNLKMIGASGVPIMYSMSGQNASGEAQLTLAPIPDAAYNLEFYYYADQAELVNDTDRLLAPSLPVILAATAMALEERGEDTGSSPNSLWQQYTNAIGAAVIRDTEASTDNYDFDAGQLI